ncbi:30S ribosomal protein S5 [Patescibacteria group bacterium]|nr:30S ribosomal protein S5 [Patescibacteria group bacterium]MBU2158675.1 30S ribosomal protein S5 [Patescibacteria group bacterium]MBU2220424.1 30S ribosomal protein S5 [Patescibacteria group bacterium]
MTDTPTMDTEKKTPEATPETAAATPVRDDRRPGGRTPGRRPGGRDSRGRGPRAPRERSEFEQATIEVRRVARVMAGGRRFSFSVTVVIGDKKGRVGVGLGKGADTALAIDKAVRDAKKHLITVARTPDGSIAHDVSVKNSSSIVTIVPSPGRGIVAGSAMRTVLEHAGVTNVVAKILTRTKNKLTIARATVDALASAGNR